MENTSIIEGKLTFVKMEDDYVTLKFHYTDSDGNKLTILTDEKEIDEIMFEMKGYILSTSGKNFFLERRDTMFTRLRLATTEKQKEDFLKSIERSKWQKKNKLTIKGAIEFLNDVVLKLNEVGEAEKFDFTKMLKKLEERL